MEQQPWDWTGVVLVVALAVMLVMVIFRPGGAHLKIYGWIAAARRGSITFDAFIAALERAGRRWKQLALGVVIWWVGTQLIDGGFRYLVREQILTTDMSSGLFLWGLIASMWLVGFSLWAIRILIAERDVRPLPRWPRITVLAGAFAVTYAFYYFGDYGAAIPAASIARIAFGASGFSTEWTYFSSQHLISLWFFVIGIGACLLAIWVPQPLAGREARFGPFVGQGVAYGLRFAVLVMMVAVVGVAWNEANFWIKGTLFDFWPFFPNGFIFNALFSAPDILRRVVMTLWILAGLVELSEGARRRITGA